MSHSTLTAVVVAGVVLAMAGGPVDASPSGTVAAAQTDQTDRIEIDANVDSNEEAVAFARNVMEVKGHLQASVRLAGDFQPEEAAFHAEHAYADYWNESSPRGPLAPAVEAANESLASDFEAELEALESASRELSPEAYERRVREEVFPLLDRALVAAVPSAYRENETFDARVTNALLERIDGEYAAAINASGDVTSREGYREYWDARGFVVQASERYEGAIAPTLDDSARTRANDSFAELQARASLERPPAELRSVAADLRSTLSSAANESTSRLD